jgi:hypothetical protein
MIAAKFGLWATAGNAGFIHNALCLSKSMVDSKLRSNSTIVKRWKKTGITVGIAYLRFLLELSYPRVFPYFSPGNAANKYRISIGYLNYPQQLLFPIFSSVDKNSGSSKYGDSDRFSVIGSDFRTQSHTHSHGDWKVFHTALCTTWG